MKDSEPDAIDMRFQEYVQIYLGRIRAGKGGSGQLGQMWRPSRGWEPMYSVGPSDGDLDIGDEEYAAFLVASLTAHPPTVRKA